MTLMEAITAYDKYAASNVNSKPIPMIVKSKYPQEPKGSYAFIVIDTSRINISDIMNNFTVLKPVIKY